MKQYFTIYFLFVISLVTGYDQETLKQAKVIEFISTKTINYIDELKNKGDNKYYHSHKQLDAYFERAKARIILNNIIDAHLDLDQVLLRDPEYWNAYYYKGKLFMMIQNQQQFRSEW